MSILFSADNMYKANLHCHSTMSDGAYSPDKLKKLYTSRGYSIIAFTDHYACPNHAGLCDENFLAINGCEVSITEMSKEWDRARTYHFNLYAGCQDLPPPPLNVRGEINYSDIAAINDYIKQIKHAGYLVCYNHAYWSMQDIRDYGGLKGLFAMEIYNHCSEVEDGYYGYTPQVYDEMLRTGQQLFCVSVDDNHNRNYHHDSFGGWIMINSPSLAYGDVMASLAAGDFYSSQGPEIYEIRLEDQKLHIRCSEVDSIVVYTAGRHCYIKDFGGITHAEFDLNGNEGYIRVMCRDAQNRDANSNAYFV